MKSFIWFAVGCAALLSVGTRAQAQCIGDCNGDGEVLVNELISGVNIALGSAELSTCPAFDEDGDGEVSISELIKAVNIALGAPCGGGDGKCGDGQMNVDGETCDDGNNFGGDGCAANCTEEDARAGVFDSTKTMAVVQTQAFPITLNISGSQTFRTGKARDTAVETVEGDSFAPGEMPVVIKATELLFDPVSVPGLVCACVRGVPVESFGPGISAQGKIGCGENGLTDISYVLSQDHNTTPGSPGNKAAGGSPDDAECDNTTELPGGVTASACKEGEGDTCSLPSNLHTGVCIGPRTLTPAGGMAPRGSAIILNNSSISLLQDAGNCAEKRNPNGSCTFPQYGPDCQPCTADDEIMQDANLLPTTTGKSSAVVYDLNNDGTGAIMGEGQSCFGVPCQTTGNGSIFDCDELANDPTGGLSGGSISVSFPAIDSAQIGDNVTTTVFFNQ
jgi:cysteine-rich repeat protein